MSVERLVVELRRDLIGYLQRKGQTIEDAEDVVQEAFVRFHRAGHDLSGADARPLLFVIARNLQTDRWKSAGRKGVRGTDDIHALDAGPRAVASDAPAGRRLDFLSQEFMREANTLCSKSALTDLTSVGLELKAVIEQFREQIQNVE